MRYDTTLNMRFFFVFCFKKSIIGEKNLKMEIFLSKGNRVSM